MHLLCEAPGQFPGASPVPIEILFAAKSAEAARVMLSGSVYGFISGYLKKRMALLRKVIELAAGPATPPLEKPVADKSRKEVLAAPPSEEMLPDKAAKDSRRQQPRSSSGRHR